MSVKYNNKMTNSYHNSQLLSLIIQLAFFYYCIKINKKLQQIVFYDLIYNRGRQIASVYICVLAVISSPLNDNKLINLTH